MRVVTSTSVECIRTCYSFRVPEARISGRCSSLFLHARCFRSWLRTSSFTPKTHSSFSYCTLWCFLYPVWMGSYHGSFFFIGVETFLSSWFRLPFERMDSHNLSSCCFPSSLTNSWTLDLTLGYDWTSADSTSPFLRTYSSVSIIIYHGSRILPWTKASWYKLVIGWYFGCSTSALDYYY